MRWSSCDLTCVYEKRSRRRRPINYLHPTSKQASTYLVNKQCSRPFFGNCAKVIPLVTMYRGQARCDADCTSQRLSLDCSPPSRIAGHIITPPINVLESGRWVRHSNDQRPVRFILTISPSCRISSETTKHVTHGRTRMWILHKRMLVSDAQGPSDNNTSDE